MPLPKSHEDLADEEPLRLWTTEELLCDPGPPLPPRDELVVEDVSDGAWDALFEALEDV